MTLPNSEHCPTPVEHVHTLYEVLEVSASKVASTIIGFGVRSVRLILPTPRGRLAVP
jgi:hypothetical protein